MESLLIALFIILIVILVFVVGIVFATYIINKIPVYIGAEYSNNYIDVWVIDVSDKIVFCVDTESDKHYYINKNNFIMQFKIKNTQGESYLCQN